MKKVSRSYKVEFQCGIYDVEVPDDFVFPSLAEVEEMFSVFLVKDFAGGNMSVSDVKVVAVTWRE